MLLPSGYSTTSYGVTAAQKGWGSGWPNCQAPSTTITLAITKQRLQVNTRSARLWTLLLNAMEAGGYRCHTPENWCWGGECRAISNTNTPSNHSWWNAVDLNAPNNPYTTSGQHDIPDWVFAMFRRYGFGLGADYNGKKDWMHVEVMGTPTDVDIMTAAAELEFGSGGGVITAPPIAKDWFDMATAADIDTAVDKAVKARMPTADDIAAAVWARSLNLFRPVGAETDTRAGDVLAAIDQRAQSLPIGDTVAGQVWAKPLDLYRQGVDEAGRRSGNVLAAIDYGVNGAGTTTAPSQSTYMVKVGDTFNGIAKAQGVTPEALKAANPAVTDVNDIAVGQVLVIPK